MTERRWLKWREKHFHLMNRIYEMFSSSEVYFFSEFLDLVVGYSFVSHLIRSSIAFLTNKKIKHKRWLDRIIAPNCLCKQKCTPRCICTIRKQFWIVWKISNFRFVERMQWKKRDVSRLRINVGHCFTRFHTQIQLMSSFSAISRRGHYIHLNRISSSDSTLLICQLAFGINSIYLNSLHQLLKVINYETNEKRIKISVWLFTMDRTFVFFCCSVSSSDVCVWVRALCFHINTPTIACWMLIALFTTVSLNDFVCACGILCLYADSLEKCTFKSNSIYAL